MLSNKQRVLRLTSEFFIVGISSVFSVTATIIGIKLLTHYLSPLNYGELSLYLTFSTLPNTMFFGPLSNAIYRYTTISIKKRNFFSFEKNVRKILIQITVILIIIVMFCSIVLYLFKNVMFIIVIALLLFFTVFSGYTNIINSVQSALRERKTVGFINVFDKFLRFFFSILFVVYVNSSALSALAGQTLAILVIFTLQYCLYKIFTRKKCSLDNLLDNNNENSYYSTLIQFSYPFFFWGIFLWLQFSSERWIVNFFENEYILGQYTLLSQIGFQTTSLIFGVITTFISPILNQQVDKNGFHAAVMLNNKVSLIYLFLGLLIVIFSFFFHEKIILLFSNKEYIVYSYLLPVIVFSSVLFNVGQNITNNFILILKPKLMQTSKILTAVLAIILNIVGEYFFGIKGLVTSVFISMLFYCLIIFFSSNFFFKSILNKTNE